MFICSPSLSLVASTCWPTLSVDVDRCSSSSGPSIRRCVATFSPLAGDGGFVRHLPQPPPASLLFADGGSAGGGGGCSGSVLGQSAGVCLPTFQPAPTSPQQSLRLPQPGAHSNSSVLAPRPWFADLLDLLVEVPVLLPLRQDLLRQPHFHQFHWNLCVLGLTGYRIASNPRDISASLQEWLVNLPSPGALPLD